MANSTSFAARLQKCSTGKAILWLAVCSLVVPGGSAAAQPPPSKSVRPPAQVVVDVVRRAELDTRQTFVGTVMPLRQSTVGSPVEGLVIELAVQEGDHVKQGAKLAQLRDKQLRLQLSAAEAELKVRQSELSELKISLPDQVEQADARMMAAKAVMEFTARRLQRTRKLVASRTISEDELQEQESAALAAEEKYRETKTALAELKAVLPTRLRQAEARVESQQWAIDQLKDDISQHQVVAPFDGYVTKEHTELGQWLTKGAPVVEMIQVDRVEVEVHVPEAYASQLRVGSMATVSVAALGRSWENQSVAAIVPQADPRSRSFPVKVQLPNRPGPGGVLLKPGMFAQVTLAVSRRPGALLVPKDAVVLGGPAPMVFVVRPLPEGGSSSQPRPDGTAEGVPVELGTAQGEWIEVRGALQPGDRVVVEGNERLVPGQPVSLLKPPPPEGQQSGGPPPR